jgi:hypothetical protein
MDDELLFTASHEHSVVLGCPVHDYEQFCDIPLPRQSHLGTYEGLEYRPTNDWRETFLCLRHGRAFVCSPRKIQLTLQARGLDECVSSLWQIDAVCAKCGGGVNTFYTAKMPNWTSIVQRVLKTNPKFLCGDHDFEWREDLMSGSEIAHGSPMP